MRLAGTRFPGKGRRWLFVPVAVLGSKMTVLHSERSPSRIRTVGTVKVEGSGCTSRSRSKDTMKNVRSRWMGPCSVPV